jgi:hypothetical protein
MAAGDTGLVQKIKLALDQQALRQLERDAGLNSRRVAEQVAKALEGAGSQGNPAARMIADMRTQFEKALMDIRHRMSQGLIDLPEATRQANDLANAYNKALEDGVKKAGRFLKKDIKQSLVDAAKVDPNAMAIELERTWTRAIGQALVGTAGKTKSMFERFRTQFGSLVMGPSVGPGQLDSKVDARLFSKAKGDTDKYNASVQQAIKLQELQGLKLTTLGKIYTWFGGNVATASSRVAGLVTQLNAAGVAKNRINAAMPTLNQGFVKLGGSILSAARALGVYYSSYQMIQFVKSAVKDNADLEKSWARLSVTVSDFGHALSSIRPAVDDSIKMGVQLGYTESQTLEVLARLVQITGDVDRSLKAHQTVLDIAASGYMTLEQATRQVGRAMIGDITNIQRYGIFLEKNKDAVTQLAARFGGEAAARAKTFRGELEIINAEITKFKTNLGAAVSEGVEANGFLETFKDLLADAAKFIKENQAGIQVWVQLVKYAFMGVVVVLAGAFGLIVKVSNAAVLAMVILIGSLKTIPPLATMAWTKMELAAVKSLKEIASWVDKVFKTHLADSFDGAIDRIEARMKDAKKNLADVVKETQMAAKEVTQGTDPTVADQQIGNARHPRARYFQNVSAEISLRRRVVFGGDEEKAEKALEKLAELREELAKQAEEAKDNDREALEYTARIAQIDKIRLDYQKQREGSAKEEAALTRRINILGNIALGEDPRNRQQSMKELVALHEELVKKRNTLNIYSDKYWVTQNHIKDIEDRIAAVHNQEDEKFKDRLERLGKQVDLQIEGEAAMRELVRLHSEQEAISKDTSRSLDDQIKARLRMIQIETTMRSEFDKAKDRVMTLGEELQTAEKRVAAEKELVRIQAYWNNQLNKGLVASTNLADVQEFIATITKLIAEGGAINVRSLDRQISNAETLIKKHRTRKEGLEEIKRLEEEIEQILARQNLTEEEKAKLIAQQERLRRDKRKAEEPSLNIKDEINSVVSDIPDAFAAAASASADVFTTAFTYILRDARNLKHALSSIPKGLAAAMLDELAKLAQGKVQEHLAWALTETALGLGSAAIGNFGAAGGHFASAGEHAAAAAAWGLVAGGVKSLGISAHRAYDNATDFVPDRATGDRGGSGDDIGKIGPDIYIMFDPFDPDNPRTQDLVGSAAQQYQNRYGGRVIYRPMTGSR